MVKQLSDFLFKRIATKLDDVRGHSTPEDFNMAMDDLEVYIETLKEITKDVLLP